MDRKIVGVFADSGVRTDGDFPRDFDRLAGGRRSRTIGGMSQASPISCELTLRVRYAESDPMGFLHHSKFFEYFEMGRTELLRQAGFVYRDVEAAGVLFAVAKVECRFRSPARYDDVLTLTTRIERITRSRIDHAYTLHRGETLICEAASTLACIDREGRLIPIPDEIYDKAHAGMSGRG